MSSLIFTSTSPLTSPLMNSLTTISPMFIESPVISPNLLSPMISPTLAQISPINFISQPDSIVPPVLFKGDLMTGVPLVNGIPLASEFGLIMQPDIFVPSIKIVPNVTSLRVPLSMYDDVCNIENIKESMIKIFYYKLLDKWLYDEDESKYLLKYLKVFGDKVELIKDIDHPDEFGKNSQEVVDKKVAFIEDRIFKKDDIALILHKFVQGTNISWCALPKNNYFVQEAIEKSLENKFKSLIEKK